MSFSSLSPFRRGSLIFPAGRRQQREGLSAVDRRLAARAQPPMTRACYRAQGGEGHARRAGVAPCGEIKSRRSSNGVREQEQNWTAKDTPLRRESASATRDSAG